MIQMHDMLIYDDITRLLENMIGKFAFGDRTIPIHARTLGPHLESPNVMGMYYGTVQSAVVYTN